MRVGSIAVGRSGYKGGTLDLTLVALDDAGYQRLEAGLTEAVAQAAISRVMPGTVTRYPVPGLRALKFVITDALPGGVYATLHAGLHWQKAAIWVLLDLELD
ncbi:MAG: hypothetical protein QF893_13580 [Alphaproteobacteria bacterium]|jgi:hypothetical protein|nr:hypothetical protein [Alphaproteobacteria bacterium]